MIEWNIDTNASQVDGCRKVKMETWEHNGNEFYKLYFYDADGVLLSSHQNVIINQALTCEGIGELK